MDTGAIWGGLKKARLWGGLSWGPQANRNERAKGFPVVAQKGLGGEMGASDQKEKVRFDNQFFKGKKEFATKKKLKETDGRLAWGIELSQVPRDGGLG